MEPGSRVPSQPPRFLMPMAAARRSNSLSSSGAAEGKGRNRDATTAAAACRKGPLAPGVRLLTAVPRLRRESSTSTQRPDRKKIVYARKSKPGGTGGSVLIRIKRKRDETPKEALLIATEANRPVSKRPMVKSVRHMLSAVSLSAGSQSEGDRKSKDKENGRPNGGTKLFKLVDTVSETDIGSKEFEKRLLSKLKREKARSGLKVAPLSMKERRAASRAEHVRRSARMQRYRLRSNQSKKQEEKGIESVKSVRTKEEFKWLDLERTDTGPGMERVTPKNATSIGTVSSSRLDAVNEKFSNVFKREGRHTADISQFFEAPKHANSHISSTDAGELDNDQSSSKALLDSEDNGYVYDLYCISKELGEAIDADKYAFVDMRGMAVPDELLQNEDDSEADDYESVDEEEEVDYPDEEDWNNSLEEHRRFYSEDGYRGYREDGYRGESSGSDLVTDQLWIREPTGNLAFSARGSPSGPTSIADLKRNFQQPAKMLEE